MKLLMVGTGYVGLVTGACFADVGHTVTCLDIDQGKIEALRKGKIPIYEPGLEEIVQRNVAAGRLLFTTDYASVADNLLLFIGVSTPPAEDGSADVHYVLSAAESIAQHLNSYAIIVNKSTVPVGTAKAVRERVAAALEARGATDVTFDVVSNPEFLKEGDAVRDFMEPDRIVFGCDDPRVEALMREAYAPFNVPAHKVMSMSVTSAELTKYAGNSTLAVRISVMNELANLCERVGADIDEVKRGVGMDSRIGLQFLNAGCGFGGSCLPKDIRALQATARKHSYAMPILSAVQKINDRQKLVLGERLLAKLVSPRSPPAAGAAAAAVTGSSSASAPLPLVIALWGLAFKAGTDDIRESAGVLMLRQLLQADVRVRVFDPVAMDSTRAIHPDLAADHRIFWATGELEAATGADAIALMTEWKQFRFLDLEAVLRVMRGCDFFDGRNLYQPQMMSRLGFNYHSIGRAPVDARRRAASAVRGNVSVATQTDT